MCIIVKDKLKTRLTISQRVCLIGVLREINTHTRAHPIVNENRACVRVYFIQNNTSVLCTPRVYWLFCIRFNRMKT